MPGSRNGHSAGSAGVAQPKKDADEHAEASVGALCAWRFAGALNKTGAPYTVCVLLLLLLLMMMISSGYTRC